MRKFWRLCCMSSAQGYGALLPRDRPQIVEAEIVPDIVPEVVTARVEAASADEPVSAMIAAADASTDDIEPTPDMRPATSVPPTSAVTAEAPMLSHVMPRVRVAESNAVARTESSTSAPVPAPASGFVPPAPAPAPPAPRRDSASLRGPEPLRPGAGQPVSIDDRLREKHEEVEELQDQLRHAMERLDIAERGRNEVLAALELKLKIARDALVAADEGVSLTSDVTDNPLHYGVTVSMLVLVTTAFCAIIYYTFAPQLTQLFDLVGGFEHTHELGLGLAFLLAMAAGATKFVPGARWKIFGVIALVTCCVAATRVNVVQRQMQAAQAAYDAEATTYEARYDQAMQLRTTQLAAARKKDAEGTAKGWPKLRAEAAEMTVAAMAIPLPTKPVQPNTGWLAWVLGVFGPAGLEASTAVLVEMFSPILLGGWIFALIGVWYRRRKRVSVDALAQIDAVGQETEEDRTAPG